ncbi:DNA-binding protein [Wenjunlia vitaminophila]|uniref:DNA-binding protein n=1 Tax=Wenjunlia vitaminophila TaxID=76728 RepID=A0A0T6LKT6_WENVI|nr:helix-turn-helix transcriptional regulator [Wenjunlia vitaminophila]KRV46661.1 DNA-binding protein [Wenjunlia vitaminophila]
MSVNINTNTIFTMRDVGDELQRMRTRAGLRQEDAAAMLNVSRYTVSKIERGRAFPTEQQLTRLLSLYEASVEERAAVQAKIDQGKSYGRAWWEQASFRRHFHGDTYRYFYIEDAAERLFVHSGTYVPGLLQTREYVEAITAFAQKQESAERREVFTESRMRRKAILTRRRPVLLDALCLESALRALVGGLQVMRNQLEYLLSLAASPNVTLRVIPYSAGAASTSGSPFTIVDFPGPENNSVVSQEKVTGEVLSDAPAEVRQARRKFADLAEHALSPQESVRRIEEIKREL